MLLLLWRHCKACACLFKCWESSIKHFSPLSPRQFVFKSRYDLSTTFAVTLGRGRGDRLTVIMMLIKKKLFGSVPLDLGQICQAKKKKKKIAISNFADSNSRQSDYQSDTFTNKPLEEHGQPAQDMLLLIRLRRDFRRIC